jgi:hypothetical protein
MPTHIAQVRHQQNGVKEDVVRKGLLCLVLLGLLSLAGLASSSVALELGASISGVPLQYSVYNIQEIGTRWYAPFSTNVDIGVAFRLQRWTLRAETTVSDLEVITLVANPNLRVSAAFHGPMHKLTGPFFELSAGVSRFGASLSGSLCMLLQIDPGVLEVEGRLGLSSSLWDGTGGWLSNLNWMASCVFAELSVRLSLGL